MLADNKNDVGFVLRLCFAFTALTSGNKMDTEIKGLTECFVARHTLDPALLNQWPVNCESLTRNRSAERLLEVK